jgi:hypothetical protein
MGNPSAMILGHMESDDQGLRIDDDTTVTGKGSELHRSPGTRTIRIIGQSTSVSIIDHTNPHNSVPTHPIPQPDGHDAPCLADQPVPRMTAMINDVIVIAKHPIG